MSFQGNTHELILENIQNTYGGGGIEGFGLWDPWGDWNWGWGGGESIFSVGTIEDLIYGGRDPTPARLPPVVISEAPSTVLPGGSADGYFPAPEHIPEGLETVIIGGQERIRSPRPAGAQAPVLDNIDPAILGNPVDPGDDQVLVDDMENEQVGTWVDDLLTVGSGIIDVIQGQNPGGYQTPPINYDPGGYGVPSSGGKVTVDTATGKVTPCRRRRRRRLLTEGDFNDLMRIATLPNNQNVRTALAKGIGRR